MSFSRGGPGDRYCPGEWEIIVLVSGRTIIVLVRGRTLFGHYLSSVGKVTILFF